MELLDKKIVKEMKDDIDDYILSDEYGPFIDVMADLERDEEIIRRCREEVKDEQ